MSKRRSRLSQYSFVLLMALVVGVIAALAASAAEAQDAICFVDGDGARWELELSPIGTVSGSVQVPLGGCAAGRVGGNYAFANAVVPLHLFVPRDLDACLPRSTFAGRFWLESGGEAEIFTFGQLAEVDLLPCAERRDSHNDESDGWWSHWPRPE